MTINPNDRIHFSWEEFRITKRRMNEYGLFYSGDRDEHGPNYSSGSGVSYSIWGESWVANDGSHATGEGWPTLKQHLEANTVLREYNELVYKKPILECGVDFRP